MGNITRIDNVLTYHEKYLDKQVVVAGWAKTVR